jgi:hypothetical protein
MVEELRGETNPVKRFLRILGPGLVTGASDDDPSGIGTDAQAGALYGYATLWTTVLMLPNDDGDPVHLGEDRARQWTRAGGRPA